MTNEIYPVAEIVNSLQKKNGTVFETPHLLKTQKEIYREIS